MLYDYIAFCTLQNEKTLCSFQTRYYVARRDRIRCICVLNIYLRATQMFAGGRRETVERKTAKIQTMFECTGLTVSGVRGTRTHFMPESCTIRAHV